MDNVIALRNSEVAPVSIPAPARLPRPIDEAALLEPAAWLGFALGWRLADKMRDRDRHDAPTVAE